MGRKVPGGVCYNGRMTATADESPPRLRPGTRPWQRRLFVVIFEHDTRGGKLFDVALFALILLSVGVVMLESVEGFRREHRDLLPGVEWGFTLLFTAEYALRLACVRRPVVYVTSFFGVVDLLAILPTFASLFVLRAQGLATIRALRLLRIFRVFKLARFMTEAAVLRDVLWQSRAKLTVFLMGVTIVVTIIGSLMYVVEGRSNPGFGSIPESIYWAVVTMATVGYGDVVPRTPLGKGLSMVLIVFGYGLIVVPTGIVTAEWGGGGKETAGRACPSCGKAGHDADAGFCKACGGKL